EKGNGNWEHLAVELGQLRKGGVTALAVVALLNCGVKPSDPMMKRALDYLRKLEPSETYVVGLQTMAFCMAGQTQDRTRIQKNLKGLEGSFIAAPSKRSDPAGWPYNRQGASPDHSLNQYALLGIHEAHLAGFKFDKEILKAVRAVYNQKDHNG